MILESVMGEVEKLDQGHAERVSRLTYELARSYGLKEDGCREIAEASRYHDIGKIALPKKLVHASGPLSQSDMERIRKHVQYGLKLIYHMTGTVAEIAKIIIASHHERWDGTGYPKGLSGESIPLCGRIVAVCDVYDALRSKRSYKKAWSHSEAMKFIENHSGTHFDPTLVRCFLGVAAG